MTEPLLQIGYRIRDSFFDRATVKSRLDDGTRRAMSKAGAYVRTRARSSLKKPRRMQLSELTPDRQRIFEARQRQAATSGEQPPQLPFAVSAPGQPPKIPTGRLKETIFFAYDTNSKSVVIGPIALSGTKGKNVPSTLESGGSESIFGRNVQIAPRPFMQPALAAERDKLPSLFEGIL